MPLAVVLKLIPVPEKPLFDFLKRIRIRGRRKGALSGAPSTSGNADKDESDEAAGERRKGMAGRGARGRMRGMHSRHSLNCFVLYASCTVSHCQCAIHTLLLEAAEQVIMTLGVWWSRVNSSACFQVLVL